MRENVEQIVDLSLAEKRALLAELLREKKGKPQAFPLSFAQQRLWFLAQLEPDNPSYNIPQILRLKGVLDINALEQAINAIIARHESLRTTFKAIDGQPVQIVSDVYEFKLPLTDLKELPEAEREAEARRLAIAEARHPFDLNRDSPLRAALVRLEDDHHWLFLTMHHIVSDGWSMGILTKELSNIYEAISTNQPIELPELPVQYTDFAEWQREWLQGEVLEEQLDYWLNSLAGAPAELKLQTDHPRPAHQSFHGAGLSLKLTQKLSRSLGEFSQREGVTLFMTMLAAFQTLLFRYTGQEDIVVGTVIAGRNRVEIENLIGFFVNTLALRTNFSGNPTFRQLLGRVKEVTLGAHAHQDLPFEKLVEELNPKRDASHSPIFQVMFGMQNAPRETLKLSGLTITRVAQASGTAKFDLTLFITETTSGLSCWLEYNTDLFEEKTIRRMLGHFENLLEGIVAAQLKEVVVETRIGALEILSSDERERLLVEWNETGAEFPAACIHELFEAQVERTPDAPAVVFESETVTYGELNRRANQLAHYLKKRGVGPDVLVGVCVERSVEMVVALLGILKAGGAYVPLDPAYPAERLAFMLEETAVPLLLTQERLLDQLPVHSGQVLCLDAEWAEREGEYEEENIASEVRMENLAYVIYTSGSTGKPKGVMIPHYGLVNYLSWCTKAYAVSEGQGSAVHSSIAFDLTITSLFAPLVVGRSVVLIPEEQEIEALASALSTANDFSLIKITPTHLQLLSQMVPAEKVSRKIKALIIGGEELRSESLEFWRTHSSGTRLINEYGPTESVVGCCVYEVADGDPSSGPVPIGKPIANTKLYIVDERMEPVPVGVAGELYIGGAGLARGYLNRPELTARAFVPDPFSVAPGARLYKTGDLARYLEDGNIEYLGRIDNQVKLRGFRIELGEIESVLKEQAEVSEALALVREDEPGDQRLVAYVVPHQAEAGSNNSSLAQKLQPALKKVLTEQLPEYMRPSEFIFLDAFPLTPNGKIDRSALPRPGPSRPELEGRYVAPRTDIELEVANIWAGVLRRDSVGINDNFFELGGHSLLATQVISRIRQHLKVELPLRKMFETPTIAGLAAAVVELRQESKPAPIPAIRRRIRGGAKMEQLSTDDVDLLLSKVLSEVALKNEQH